MKAVWFQPTWKHYRLTDHQHSLTLRNESQVTAVSLSLLCGIVTVTTRVFSVHCLLLLYVTIAMTILSDVAEI